MNRPGADGAPISTGDRSMAKPGRRFYSETIDLRLPVGEGHHHLAVSLVYDGPERDRLREIAFTRRGKSGGQLDRILVELGIMLSRAVQNWDPHTGAAL